MRMSAEAAQVAIFRMVDIAENVRCIDQLFRRRQVLAGRHAKPIIFYELEQ
jgi:hypothetical protein